jgi:predicted permease
MFAAYSCLSHPFAFYTLFYHIAVRFPFTVIKSVFPYLVVASVIAKFRKYDEGLKNAFMNSVMFYNSGNIGIPLITLIYSSSPFIVDGKTPYLSVALTTQVIVLIMQNISTNTIGFYNAGKGSMTWEKSIKSILHMPTIYMVSLAFCLKAMPFRLEKFPIWPAFMYPCSG